MMRAKKLYQKYITFWIRILTFADKLTPPPSRIAEVMPKMLMPVEWESVKATIRQAVKGLA